MIYSERVRDASEEERVEGIVKRAGIESYYSIPAALDWNGAACDHRVSGFS